MRCSLKIQVFDSELEECIPVDGVDRRNNRQRKLIVAQICNFFISQYILNHDRDDLSDPFTFSPMKACVFLFTIVHLSLVTMFIFEILTKYFTIRICMGHPIALFTAVSIIHYFSCLFLLSIPIVLFLHNHKSDKVTVSI